MQALLDILPTAGTLQALGWGLVVGVAAVLLYQHWTTVKTDVEKVIHIQTISTPTPAAPAAV